MPYPTQPAYRTLEQIEALVQAFETDTLPNTQFNHHAHMTMALWYLIRMAFAEAVNVMRMNIQCFAASHHHSQLYHETITLF